MTFLEREKAIPNELKEVIFFIYSTNTHKLVGKKTKMVSLNEVK